jgi:hypothetical protein
MAATLPHTLVSGIIEPLHTSKIAPVNGKVNVFRKALYCLPALAQGGSAFASR